MSEAIQKIPSSLSESCSTSARDLVSRLLTRDPRYRLRTLLSMKNISFFKDFSFEDVRAKKVNCAHFNLPENQIPKPEVLLFLGEIDFKMSYLIER